MEPPGHLLYYLDPTLRSFEARVAVVEKDGVVLDRTAFFPGGGGQEADSGTVEGRRVVRAEQRGDRIVHVFERPGEAAHFRAGQAVRGELDWERRSDLMRGHSGEHLLVGRLLEVEPKLELVKVHLAPGKKSIFLRGALTWDVVREAVHRANRRIAERHDVRPRFVSEEEAKRLGSLRIKWERLEGIDAVRIVSMGNFDHSACSGVHVANLADLHMVVATKLTSAGQGVTELEFAVGPHAVGAATTLAMTAAEAAQTLGAPVENVVPTVRNLLGGAKTLEERVRSLGRRVAAQLPVVEHKGVRLTMGVLDGVETKDMLDEAAKRLAEPNFVVLLVDRAPNGLLFVGFSEALAKERQLDAREILKDALAPFGGKGGGKPNAAQGGFPTPGDGEKVLERSWTLVAARLGFS